MLLALVLVLGTIPLVPAKEAEAAKKMQLSKTKLSLKVGKTKKLTVKNKKKKAKVTWSTSKKKVATVSKKGVVKAKKAGKATITAKVKYNKTIKKLKCKVTVTKAKKKQPTKKSDTKSTAKPTAQATDAPVNQATAQPTGKPTPSPVSQMPEPAEARDWDTEKMGSFTVTGIRFEDNSLTYQLGRNAIYLNIGNQYFDVKEAVPDLTKCIFEVCAGGKIYNNVVSGGIQWKNKKYSDEELEIYTDAGYYEFVLYINVDGTTYRSSWVMAEYRDEISDSGKDFLISAIKTGQKTITPQKDMRSAANHYMIHPVGASVKADLPDLERVEFTAVYMGKRVEIEKISKIRWFGQSYYETYEEGTGYYTFTLSVRNGAQRISVPVILSDYKDQLDVYQYSWRLAGEENKGPVQEYNTVLPVEIPGNKSLKEVFPDLSQSFTFSCVYQDEIYENVKPGNVRWVNEPFHDNKCDSGYYIFTLSVTANGQEKSREFMLTEKYRGITYEVSGKLYSGTDETPSGQELRFWSSDNGASYKVTTGEGGTYKVQLPEGGFHVYWNGCRLNNYIRVDKKNMTQDIRTSMYKVSGIITRLGNPMADCDIRFVLIAEGDSIVSCHTGKGGAYSVWLPKDCGVYLKINDLTLTSADYDMLSGISENISRNIEVDRIKVTGTLCQRENVPLVSDRCYFVKEGELFRYGIVIDDEGRYEAYLEPDTIYNLMYGEGIRAGTVQTGKTDFVKDVTIGVTKIKGTLKTKSGGVVSNIQRMNFYTADETLAATAYSERGTYSVDLKPGTYTIKIETELYDEEHRQIDLTLDQKLTVGSENQITDIITPFYKVSGIIYNNSDIWCGKVKIYNSENHSMMIWTEEEDGSYETYLPAGTYFFNIQENDAKKKTIAVTDSDIQQNLNYSYPLVKGNIYRVKQGQQFEQELNMENPIYLQIVDEQDNYVETIYPEEGIYECYVPGPGTYKVKYGNMVVDSIIVDSDRDPVTSYDIVCKLYLVSGVVTGVRDMKYVYNDLLFCSEEGKYIWTNKGTPDFSKREQPFFVLLAEGTYRYEASFNDDKKVGDLTISGDKADVAINMPVMVQVNGTLTDSEGNPCQSEDIEMVAEDGLTKYFSTDKKGGYQFYVHPGTYTVYCIVQKDGMDLRYKHGTLTVGAEDMTYNIQKKAAEDIDSSDIGGPGPVNPPDMPKYKVSGTLSGKSGVWANTEIQIGVETVTTDENGRYELDVYPGEHPVYIPGIADQEPETVSVTDSDVEKDISLDYVRICGRLLHGGKPVGESDLVLFKGQDESMEFVTSVKTGEDGSYTFYISPNIEYTIQFSATGTELVRGRVQQNDTKDQELTLAGTKVSGTIIAADKTPLKGVSISFVAADGEEATPALANYNEDSGTYFVYMMPGTYKVTDQDGNVLKDSVVIEDTDMTCDIETSLYRVDVISQGDAEFLLFGEDEFRTNVWSSEKGSSVYLINGTYTLVKYNDAVDPETKNEIPLEDIAEDKKTTFTVEDANTKVEIK